MSEGRVWIHSVSSLCAPFTLSLFLLFHSLSLSSSLSLAGRASESRGRQTGSLTLGGDAIIAGYTGRALFSSSSSSLLLSLRSLTRFPVAHGISETWNNERCKSRERKSAVCRNSQGEPRNIKVITKEVCFLNE